MGRISNFIRNINYLTKHSLWDEKEQQIVYLTNKILNDTSYEFDLNYVGKKHLNILNADETIELLGKKKKSFLRTGDGEITLMKGEDHSFQRYEKIIAERLIDALENPKENLLVGINRNYFRPLMTIDNPPYYRRNAYEFRKFYLEHCKEGVQYIDATCIGRGEHKENPDGLYNHYERWKKLFEGEDIVIVCGEGILDAYKYDVFELANSKSFIYGPRVNAWDKREEIIGRIKGEVSKDKILVFILGQAGKAMITELVDFGYVCWDVGHLAKYYNAVMTNMEWNEENTAKFFAPD